MRWFAAVATPTMFGVAGETEPWSFALALEGGSIPSLSEEERRVGFSGTKVEDLNRAPLFGRPLVHLGLPGDFTFSAGWVPPIDFDGVTPNLLSLALARPLWKGSAGGSGRRSSTSTARSKVTSPVHRTKSTPATTRTGTLRLRRGLGRHACRSLRGARAGLRLAGDVDGRAPPFPESGSSSTPSSRCGSHSGFEDRNKLVTTATITPGRRRRLAGDRELHLAGELFYSALDVVRDPSGRGRARTTPSSTSA